MKSGLTRLLQPLSTAASFSPSKQTWTPKSDWCKQTSKQKGETKGGFHLWLKAFLSTSILYYNINTSTLSTNTNTADPDRGVNGHLRRCKEQDRPGCFRVSPGNLANRRPAELWLSLRTKLLPNYPALAPTTKCSGRTNKYRNRSQEKLRFYEIERINQLWLSLWTNLLPK